MNRLPTHLTTMRRPFLSTGNALASAVLVLLGTGCGSQPGLPAITTAPVKGVATYHGEPLEKYRVFFYCDSSAAPEPATGLVAADGAFELSVRTPGDGAQVGRNRVWLVYEPEIPPDATLADLAKIPPPKVKLPVSISPRTPADSRWTSPLVDSRVYAWI